MTIKVNSTRILEAMKKEISVSSVVLSDQIASTHYNVLKDLGLIREADELRKHWKDLWSGKV
jgi:D-ribose pyranose/furanose isomerase RbsD